MKSILAITIVTLTSFNVAFAQGKDGQGGYTGWGKDSVGGYTNGGSDPVGGYTGEGPDPAGGYMKTGETGDNGDCKKRGKDQGGGIMRTSLRASGDCEGTGGGKDGNGGYTQIKKESGKDAGNGTDHIVKLQTEVYELYALSIVDAINTAELSSANKQQIAIRLETSKSLLRVLALASATAKNESKKSLLSDDVINNLAISQQVLSQSLNSSKKPQFIEDLKAFLAVLESLKVG